MYYCTSRILFTSCMHIKISIHIFVSMKKIEIGFQIFYYVNWILVLCLGGTFISLVSLLCLLVLYFLPSIMVHHSVKYFFWHHWCIYFLGSMMIFLAYVGAWALAWWLYWHWFSLFFFLVAVIRAVLDVSCLFSFLLAIPYVIK